MIVAFLFLFSFVLLRIVDFNDFIGQPFIPIESRTELQVDGFFHQHSIKAVVSSCKDEIPID